MFLYLVISTYLFTWRSVVSLRIGVVNVFLPIFRVRDLEQENIKLNVIVNTFLVSLSSDFSQNSLSERVSFQGIKDRRMRLYTDTVMSSIALCEAT